MSLSLCPKDCQCGGIGIYYAHRQDEEGKDTHHGAGDVPCPWGQVRALRVKLAKERERADKAENRVLGLEGGVDLLKEISYKEEPRAEAAEACVKRLRETLTDLLGETVLIRSPWSERTRICVEEARAALKEAK